MSLITLYHGSPCIVNKPELSKGKPYNDYGQGFYCTDDINLANEWACPSLASDGFANEYTLDSAGLTILNLNENPHGVLGWVATLMQFRRVNYPLGTSMEHVNAFIETYRQDLSRADVVEGYRADDSYFDIIRAFIGNNLSISSLESALLFGQLGRQIVLKSERAFGTLAFVQSHDVPAQIWHTKRTARNQSANQTFKESIYTRTDIEGAYFRDIMRKLQAERRA